MLQNRKMFDIVHFVQSGNGNKKKSIDCVPSSWIYFDKKKHQLMTKFMPPYTTKKCNTLHKLIKANGNAQDNWPNYPIKIMERTGIMLYYIIYYKKGISLYGIPFV